MRIIDLTQTLKNGSGGFKSEPAMNVRENGWNASTLQIYSHAGTHIDAPPHLNNKAKGIDEMPVERFIAECRIIDLTSVKPSELLTSGHLGRLKEEIESGEGMLLKTGWYKHISNRELYRNAMPRISEELANWCVSRKIKIIGVETPSVADVNNIDELTLIHGLFLNAGITIVEGLVNLDQIIKDKVQFIALPLKIEGGDGSPCRAIAIEN